MWKKLFSLGMSGKLIRILKSLYENATTKVRMEHGLTQPIDITEGVLQGEILSPFLYNLYVSEIEKLLINSNIPGVKITRDFFLHLLCYADDTVVLAYTPVHLQQKINILRSYFDELGLKVNLSKTKVMVFRRGGRLQHGLDFRYGEDKVEIVSEYTYLGVPFSSSGVFVKAAKHFKQKGMAALGSVWKVIMGGKTNSWFAKYTLFRSICCSSTLYASHLWGLRYLELVEDVQQHFYKKLMGVSRLVPRYLVRLECGVPPMKLHIIKQCLMYMVKVNNMEEHRYTKKCFIALYNEYMSGEYGPLNWIGQYMSSEDLSSNLKVKDTVTILCLLKEQAYPIGTTVTTSPMMWIPFDIPSERI
ncbi:LINE-1 retrotransposable element ORF2 protein [Folsomia candida]|uniref:LINE-1 retrotransposable element ORF2 protein n=1 Tax=Folsomia candida TaxID=158441 RepID=A0A226DH49_FOLCA|nr:LINE-1 retrotransposable element ORF2 protein [Folsomia candida]